jgi:hypothetical protein
MAWPALDEPDTRASRQQLLRGRLSNRLPEMSDPSQAPAPPLTAAGPQRPPDFAWRERGGLRGFFDGRQSLALAFWLLGVGVALLITVVGLGFDAALPRAAFIHVLLGTTLATIVTRIIAWYCILACRRNTRSEVFSALALSAVALDIVMGAFRWPALLFALSMV